jgi:hypothetical protein
MEQEKDKSVDTSGEFSFDDNEAPVKGNTIAMGDTVEGEGDEVQSVVDQAMKEEKSEGDLQKFKEFCGDKPYIVFDKKDVAHFIDLIGYHSRLGYDHYTLSFKLDTTELEKTGKVNLVYNNGSVFGMSEVAVQYSGIVTPQIISVDTLLRVFSASTGYLCLFEEETDMYGYVFGGKVYLETVRVETDICTKEYLTEQLSTAAQSTTQVSPVFISTLRMLYDIIKTGSRIEEKAIYFKDDSTYIYSGVVLGEFKGVGCDLTLQDIDISTLARFFFDVNEIITITDHDIFMKYTSGGRSVYLAKRGLELSDDMRYQGLKSKSGVSVDVNEIMTIVSFLLGLPNNAGSINITPADGGLVLTCFQKAIENSSNFKLKGIVSGDGIEEVKMQLDVLKTFLRVFKGQVTLKTNGNKLYVSGDEGEIVIFGNL